MAKKLYSVSLQARRAIEKKAKSDFGLQGSIFGSHAATATEQVVAHTSTWTLAESEREAEKQALRMAIEIFPISYNWTGHTVSVTEVPSEAVSLVASGEA